MAADRVDSTTAQNRADGHEIAGEEVGVMVAAGTDHVDPLKVVTCPVVSMALQDELVGQDTELTGPVSMLACAPHADPLCVNTLRAPSPATQKDALAQDTDESEPLGPSTAA